MLKQVVVGLIKKGKLPKQKELRSFVTKMGKSLGWAVLMLPVVRLVNNKEMFVPVAFSILVLATRLGQLIKFGANKAKPVLHKIKNQILQYLSQDSSRAKQATFFLASAIRLTVYYYEIRVRGVSQVTAYELTNPPIR